MHPSLQTQARSGVFLKMRKPSDLAFLLNVRPEDLLRLTMTPHYTSFSIPKKSGGSRTVLAPDPDLKNVQRAILGHLNYIGASRTHACAYGFIKRPICYAPRRDIKANAQVHLGQQFVFNTDIKDFFPSIKYDAVYRVFTEELELPKNISHLLSRLLTYKGALPQGAPTSPVLSNLVCLSMDRELWKYAEQRKLNYSRYADDITLSGMYIDKENTENNIKSIVARHGFTLHDDKTRLSNWKQRQTVTGVTVNVRTNVSRKYIRHIRAMLNDWSVNGFATAASRYRDKKNCTPSEFRTIILGKISFIGFVRGKDDAIYRKLSWELKVLEELERLKKR